ncbi:MAG TPA: hypothetical protein VKE74_26455 [Gemmataceae bacterium]|nr:hypothetical protein [Gemmataceae bacterium]
MRPAPFPALALLLSTAAPAGAADLTPLYPDRAWIVLGVDVRAVHRSPLGKEVFGTDGPAVAARKLLTALGGPEAADDLKALAPLDPLLDRVERLTAVTSEGGEPPDSDDLRVFLEGDFDDDALARAIEGACRRQKVPYRAEPVGGRTVHVVGEEGRRLRVFRVDEGTVAVVLTPAAVADVLDRRAGRKKSKAPTAVVEGVRAIDRAATPIWLVVGENRVGGRVEHSRMVATVALKEDATLRVRMETPDAAAAGRCRKTLELYAGILAGAKDNRLLRELGESASVETAGTVVTATAVLPGNSFAEVYAKQK